MDKENVVYACNGILFSLRKDGNPDTCYNTDEHWRPYMHWRKLVTEGQILYDSIFMKLNSWRYKVEQWLPGVGERRNGSYYLMGRVQFCRMRKVQEMYGEDGYTTTWRYYMPLNYLNVVKMISFMIFCHSFLKVLVSIFVLYLCLPKLQFLPSIINVIYFKLGRFLNWDKIHHLNHSKVYNPLVF